MKLSKNQTELLAAMKDGVIVHFISGLNSYYFRSDNHKKCTATVEALMDKGLAERVEYVQYKYDVLLTQKGKEFSL